MTSPNPDPIRDRFPGLLFAVLLVLDVSLDLSQRAARGEVVADGWRYYLHLLADPWFIVSMVIPFLQLITWTRILSRVDLSLASPLTSLNFPLMSGLPT